MSDQHPRPWRVDDEGRVVDANGESIAYYDGGQTEQLGYEAGVADLIVAAVNAHSPWISVEDRLPEDRGYYLIAFDAVPGYKPEVVLTVTSAESWDEDFHDAGRITHWRPLLAPP